MPWSGLTRDAQMVVLLRLEGAAQYVAGITEAQAATARLKRETKLQAEASALANRQSFIYRQGLFTARRGLFYLTMGVVGATAAIVKMGFAYNSALQESRAAMGPLMGDQVEMNKILGRLWHLAAITPFQFKDVTQAFRIMFTGFKSVGLSASFTYETMARITDALSLAGKVTPAALNRVSTALQHMAFIGKPTGQVVLQLNRLGVPFTAALRQQLHLTSDQIANIAESGVTAQQAIEALNKFIAKTPGFKDAAFRIQQKTLIGAWSTFKDLLSQAAGTSTRGLFSGLHSALQGINQQLDAFYRGDKVRRLSLTKLAEVIDKQLTPKTHALFNTFILVSSIVRSILVLFYGLYKIMQVILWPINKLGDLFGVSALAARLLGYWLGFLIFYLMVTRTAMILGAAAILLYRESLFLVKEMMRGLVWVMTRLVIPAFFELAVAAYANPYVLLAAAIVLLIGGLVILYFKWNRFHNLVNNTYEWIKKHWKLVTIFIAAANAPLALLIFVTIELAKHFKTLVGWLKAAWDWIVKIWSKVPFHRVINAAFGAVLGAEPAGAAIPPGGQIRTPRGMQAGTSFITPGFNASTVEPAFSMAGMGGFGQQKPEIIQLVVDRKVLAEAVAHARQDKIARK